jgi:hypothetical protein
MSLRKSICTREPRKRRKALEKQKLCIASQVPTRTLKPSARKEIARKRAPRLYIYPGDKDPATRSRCDSPRASLLGLPMELRQQILQEAFDTKELENMVEQRRKIHQRLTVVEMEARNRLKKSQERVLKITLTPIQSDYITILRERVRELRSVSSFTYQDMEYVKGCGNVNLKDTLNCSRWGASVRRLMTFRSLGTHGYRKRKAESSKESITLNLESGRIAAGTVWRDIRTTIQYAQWRGTIRQVGRD